MLWGQFAGSGAGTLNKVHRIIMKDYLQILQPQPNLTACRLKHQELWSKPSQNYARSPLMPYKSIRSRYNLLSEPNTK